MATSRSIQKELDNLRKEIDGLRDDYARIKNRAKATTAEGAERFGAIRDDLLETVDAIREKVTSGTGAAVDEIADHLGELRDVVSEYSEKTEKTVAAHPLATVAGAIVVGYLIGRLGR